MASCSHLLADNCSAAALPLLSPFKVTLASGKFLFWSYRVGRCRQKVKGKAVKQEELCQAVMLQAAVPLTALSQGNSAFPQPLSCSVLLETVEADCVFLLFKSRWALCFRRIRTGKVLKPKQYCKGKKRSLLVLCFLLLFASFSALTLALDNC